MKKAYIAPVLTTIYINTNNCLLAGSETLRVYNDDSLGAGDKGDLLGRDFDFDDEEY